MNKEENRRSGGIVNYHLEQRLGDRVWKLPGLDSRLRLLMNILSIMTMIGIINKDSKVEIKDDPGGLCQLPPRGLSEY